MNILYISKLSGNLWAGPNNSVPEQIRAQSTIDNCFWYNINYNKNDEWNKNGLNCWNLNDFPSGKLADLPDPFNHPDLTIIEELYCFPFERIIVDLIRAHIPYVIIPRSTLTEQAQRKKRLKKKIGNILFFRWVLQNATAIQFLTEQEKRESTLMWSGKSFVIPNGIHYLAKRHEKYAPKGIQAVYVGRIEIYQKGLDMLLQAIASMKPELEANYFTLRIYGPDREGACRVLEQIIREKQLGKLVFICGPVFGEEKHRILSSADLFIMTSRFEGLPMSLIEALAHYLPCITTKGTNLADKIEEANAGWTADNNAESISTALLTMLQERGLLMEKGMNAGMLASQYFWDQIADVSHTLYSQIIVNTCNYLQE